MRFAGMSTMCAELQNDRFDLRLETIRLQSMDIFERLLSPQSFAVAALWPTLRHLSYTQQALFGSIRTAMHKLPIGITIYRSFMCGRVSSTSLEFVLPHFMV